MGLVGQFLAKLNQHSWVAAIFALGVLSSGAIKIDSIALADEVLPAAAGASAKVGAIHNAAERLELYHKNVGPLLKTYCYDCHGNGEKSGHVAFDELTNHEQVLNPELWLKVLKNLRAGIMPPAGEARPTAAELAQIEDWIKISAFGSDPNDLDPGRVTLRRLNRTEYKNAIRDLLGVEFDVETALPPDDVGYGFDNIGDVLSISPIRLEKFIEAAIAVVDLGVPKDTLVIPSVTYMPQDFVDEDGRNGDHLSFYQVRTVSKTVHAKAAGDYNVHIYCKIDGDETFDPQEVRIHVTSDGKEFFTQQHKYNDNLWLEYDVVIPWEAGDHVVSFTTEPVNPELRPLRTKMEYRIVYVRFDGPMDRKHWVHPPGFAKLYTRDTPPTEPQERRAYAREVLEKFASKAFRRPVSEETLSRLVDLAESTYSTGNLPFEAGVAPAIVAILSSPQFLFHVEQTEPLAAGETYPRIDEYSLASRLSFALWCSLPDDELTRTAADGELRKNLASQVKRMLADPKSQSFVESFANQWLQTRAIVDIPINSADILALETPPAAAASAELAPAAAAPPTTNLAGTPPVGAAPDGVTPADPLSPANFAPGERRGGRGFGPAEATPAADPLSPGNLAPRGARGAAAAGRRGGRGGRRGRGGEVFNGTELTPTVRSAMKQEVENYFAHVMREDRSILEFLDSNYTFVNAALAPVYGIPDVTGLEMRKVELPPDSLRGGVLTMGGVLTVTSNPTRTSPVKRGKWILEHILGSPTAPPPPDVPALEDSLDKTTGRKPTQRELLAKHREDALCASCHARMDPLGLAMENFNGFGRFRTMELQQPIDPAGELITGEKFAGAADVKKALVSNHKREFYQTLTGKLLTYVLGRGIEHYDVPTIDAIVDRIEKEDGRFSALLMGVLESAPVQKRRPTPVADVAATASSNSGG